MYWIYGEGMTPLYVGITDDVDRRLREHSTKVWWPDVRKIDTRPYPWRESAAKAEAGEIRRLKPKWNTKHNIGSAPAKPVIPPQNTTLRRNLISVSQAAEYLGVNSKTLRSYISQGKLTGYRMGPRLIRVDANEVDALMRPMPTADGF